MTSKLGNQGFHVMERPNSFIHALEKISELLFVFTSLTLVWFYLSISLLFILVRTKVHKYI